MLLHATCVTLAAAVASASLFAADSEKPKGKDKLYHVVAVKFKDGTGAADKQAIAAAFSELKKKIKEVKDFVGGESVSVEKLNKDFEYCAVLAFKDIPSLKAYIEHPEHKAFVEQLKKHMADVFVFDFWD
jgi:antibiotic biosynthesis monooxygenase (ABM) superfamily enzyme